MTLRPATPEDLAAALRAAHESRTHVTRTDLSGMVRVLEHTPEDMTVTVQAGCTLAVLQAALAQRGQWLPIDPPFPDRLTIAALLDSNASGPRRCGHGTIREHLIGLRVALADGRLIRSGGKVVKNVAGYDVLKLFLGAHGTLGVIVEATFKLLPLHETEAFVCHPCPSLEEAETLLNAVFESDLAPSVLDLHNLPPFARPGGSCVVLGFSGTRADVDWQLASAAHLGFSQPATLDYDAALQEGSAPPHRLSVLPSRLIQTLRDLGESAFVARAANGIICHSPKPGGPGQHESPVRSGMDPDPVALKLMRRVKETFDPRHVFPELRA